MRCIPRTRTILYGFLLLAVAAIGLYATPLYAKMRYSAHQSNLIATNQYQAAATLVAFQKHSDVELRKSRDAAERQRQNAETLRSQLRSSRGANADLMQKLDRAEQAAADAQFTFTKELALRDAQYARARSSLIASAEEFLRTDAGARYLELVNRGDLEAWQSAKQIWDYELAALTLRQELELAARIRAHAPQARDKREKGQETTGYVIRLYEEVTANDPSKHWDWVYLARLYRDAGNISKSLDASQRALKTASDNGDRATALDELGDGNALQGQFQTAGAFYQQALEIRLRIAKADVNSLENQHNLLASYHRLGSAAQFQKDFVAARSNYTLGKDIAMRLVEADRSSIESWRELSVSYNRLGTVALIERQFGTARGYYVLAYDIARQIADAEPSSAAMKRNLSQSQEALGDVAMALGDLDASRSFYRDAYNNALFLLGVDKGSALYRRDMAVISFRMASVGDMPWASVRDQFQSMQNAGILDLVDAHFLRTAEARVAAEAKAPR